ncbi:YqgE/AlgH family protein [Marispirochaeta aestuarii]|uniref:YqgE/AlgH family protein n=1 Tax=Marispirochaeta aestuarii TaxID=1963862 RepID=UPI0029C88753|nr:YqgE/AlgH family protein [Marispirochaeta aestuarii]
MAASNDFFRGSDPGNKNRGSLEGHFLISETELTDPNFIQTVVYLVEHNDNGALGFVVNRKSETALKDVIPEFTDSPAGELEVYLGGPVEQMFLFTLHSGLPGDKRSDAASSSLQGVILEPDFELIRRFLSEQWPDLNPEHRPEIRFYAGYAGWAPGQLENELRHGAWVVIPATPGIVFAPEPEESWRNALRKKGGIYWVVAETGFKPSMN